MLNRLTSKPVHFALALTACIAFLAALLLYRTNVTKEDLLWQALRAIGNVTLQKVVVQKGAHPLQLLGCTELSVAQIFKIQELLVSQEQPISLPGHSLPVNEYTITFVETSGQEYIFSAAEYNTMPKVLFLSKFNWDEMANGKIVSEYARKVGFFGIAEILGTLNIGSSRVSQKGCLLGKD